MGSRLFVPCDATSGCVSRPSCGGPPAGAERLIPHCGYHGAGSMTCNRYRLDDELRVEKCEVPAVGPNIDQHATGRGTRVSSSDTLTGAPDMATACRLACDRNARGSQFQLRLKERACAARASAAAARWCSCRRISASTSIVKKLYIAAPVLLHHDSVDRTWQRVNCEIRIRGESGCEVVAP
jgi:hypothetical protein